MSTLSTLHKNALIDLFVDEMSERLLISFLRNILHGAIHWRTPRTLPRRRNLPRRHFFSVFPPCFDFFLASTFSNFTLVSHEEIRCRLASAWCDRLYRAEVSKATGPTSAHSREAVQCPSSRTKCNDRKFWVLFNICSFSGKKPRKYISTATVWYFWLKNTIEDKPF